MNHYVQQAENFHDEMTILSMKASDDFLSQTRIRLPASSLYLPAKYVLLLQFFYGLKKPAGPKKDILLCLLIRKRKESTCLLFFNFHPEKCQSKSTLLKKTIQKLIYVTLFFHFRNCFFEKCICGRYQMNHISSDQLDYRIAKSFFLV